MSQPLQSLLRSSALCALALGWPTAQAASPASGTISVAQPKIEVTGGPFVFPNVTSQTEVIDQTGAPVCVPGAVICDTFDLALDLPADYFTTHPTDLVKVTLSWPAATGQEDYDLFLMDAAGSTVITQGDGTTNPEKLQICAGQGKSNYQIQAIPWNALGASYKMTIELVTTAFKGCKAPKSGEAPVAISGDLDKSASAGTAGGALGLALLLPLFGFGLRRRA